MRAWYLVCNLIRWPFIGDDGLTPWERRALTRRFDRTIGRRSTSEERDRLRALTARATERCSATNEDGVRCAVLRDPDLIPTPDPHTNHLFYRRNAEGKIERA